MKMLKHQLWVGKHGLREHLQHNTDVSCTASQKCAQLLLVNSIRFRHSVLQGGEQRPDVHTYLTWVALFKGKIRDRTKVL